MTTKKARCAAGISFTAAAGAGSARTAVATDIELAPLRRGCGGTSAHAQISSSAECSSSQPLKFAAGSPATASDPLTGRVSSRSIVICSWVGMRRSMSRAGPASRRGGTPIFRRLSPSRRERRRQLLARADVELGVRPPEVRLDRLAGHEQRLGDLGVRQPAGGEVGDPPLARGQRVDAAQLQPARARAGRQQVVARLLGEHGRAAALRQVERLAQRLARLAAAVGAPLRRAEVGERPRVLQARRRRRQQLGGPAEPGDHRVAVVAEQRDEPLGAAERPRRAPRRARRRAPRRRAPGRRRARRARAARAPARSATGYSSGLRAPKTAVRRPHSSRSAIPASASPCARRSRPRAREQDRERRRRRDRTRGRRPICLQARLRLVELTRLQERGDEDAAVERAAEQQARAQRHLERHPHLADRLADRAAAVGDRPARRADPRVGVLGAVPAGARRRLVEHRAGVVELVGADERHRRARRARTARRRDRRSAARRRARAARAPRPGRRPASATSGGRRAGRASSARRASRPRAARRCARSARPRGAPRRDRASRRRRTATRAAARARDPGPPARR